VGIPRENDGGGGDGKPYESFAGEDVNVNITDMGAYFKEMHDIQTDASGPAKMEVTDLGQLIQSSFMNTADGAGILPEGAQMGRTMMDRQSDFNFFMTDVLEGVRNIGAAAIVVAEMYHDTDFTSAAGVDDIAFAFSDPNAKGPKGFRKTESFSEAEQRMREQAGQNAMALMGDDSFATPHSPYGGIMIYTFPDGSSKQVVTVPYGNSHTRTETTIYGANHKVLTSTVEETNGQNRSTSTTTYDGESGAGTRATTKTSNGHDGTVTVTNETSTVDKDGHATGKPEEHTTTVKTGQHTSGGQERGPVEDAVDKLGTHGTKDYVKDNGIGY
jgi:hypothetical protein